MATLDAPVAKSTFDSRDYRSLRLDNGLRVLLVRDADTRTASAAMAIGAGAAKDPDGTCGIAHFTEHMSMQGSDLFPQDNAYKSHLNAHGGRSNATTSMEHTWYRFEISDNADNQALQSTLDIYARFFVKPLFNPEFVAREVKAIDAEDSKNRTNDERRLLQVMKAVTNKACSFHKYSTGCLETLVDLPAKADPPIQVHQLMTNFHATNYHPNNMALILVANAQLDDMQEMVTARFNMIPAGPPLPEGTPDIIADRVLTDQPPFVETHQLPTLVKFRPMRELRRLQLMWEVPVVRPHWRGSPTALLSHLLGHEGEGSIFAQLQNRGWITSLSAGDRIDQADVACFNVRMELTTEGEQHWQEAGAMVFQYVRQLTDLFDQDPTALNPHWEEYRQMGKVNFENEERAGAFVTATALCRRLHLYGAADVLTAGKLQGDIDMPLVRQYLSMLTPHKCIVFRTSPAFTAPPKPGEQQAGDAPPPDLPLTERWYGVPYGQEPLGEDVIGVWSVDAADPPTLRLPSLNPYIPDDLSLLCDEEGVGGVGEAPDFAVGADALAAALLACGCTGTDYNTDCSTVATPGAFASGSFRAATAPPPPPQSVQNLVAKVTELRTKFRPPVLVPTEANDECADPEAEVWFKLDTVFRRPKAHATVLLVTPEVSCDPAHAALLFRLLRHTLQQRLYPADLAGLYWNLSVHTHGLVLSVGGYSQRLSLLVHDVLDALLALNPEELADKFGTVKEQLVKNYRNFSYERADSHAHFNAAFFLEKGRWPVEEKLAACESATAESLGAFHRRLLASVNVKALVHGNITQANATDLCAQLNVKLKAHGAGKLTPARHPELRAVELPVGRFVLRAPPPSPAEKNSAMFMIFAVGQLDTDPKRTAMLSLLAQLVREPSFTALRTRGQLGYIVQATTWDYGAGKGAGVDCLALNVLSKTHSPPQVEQKAKEFFRDFRTTLGEMGSAELGTAKAALQSKLLEPPKQLSAENGRWWREIQYGDHQWDRREIKALAIESITLADMVAFYDEVVISKESRRQLSVHVHSNNHPISPDDWTVPDGAAAAEDAVDDLPTIIERDEWRTWQNSFGLHPASVNYPN